MVFFKLQLVMFFDGIRSERHLMQPISLTGSACVGLLATIWMNPCPIMCAVSVFVRLLLKSRRLRAVDLLGQLTDLAQIRPRGQEHVSNAAQREGMEREAPQVLYA